LTDGEKILKLKTNFLFFESGSLLSSTQKNVIRVKNSKKQQLKIEVYNLNSKNNSKVKNRKADLK
jgi:hypothetical protein